MRMLVSTNTTPVMDLAPVVHSRTLQREARLQHCFRALACGFICTIFGYQVAVLVRQHGADAAPPPCRNRARLLEQGGLDRHRNVLFCGHGLQASDSLKGSRKIRERSPRSISMTGARSPSRL